MFESIRDIKDDIGIQSTAALLAVFAFVIISFLGSIWLIQFAITGFFENHLLLPDRYSESGFSLFIGIPKQILCLSLLLLGFLWCFMFTVLPVLRFSKFDQTYGLVKNLVIDKSFELVAAIAVICLVVATTWQMYSEPL